MVLMEGKPKGVDFEQVTDTFLSIEEVVKVHNLRIWALSLDKIALSAHLAISKCYFLKLMPKKHFNRNSAIHIIISLSEPGVNPQKILSIASKSIREKYNFFEMTLQIEDFEQNMDLCNKCKMPEK